MLNLSGIKNISRNADIVSIVQEMKSGSITERTLKERDYTISAGDFLGLGFIARQDDFFKETYEYGKSSTVRFGINPHGPSIVEMSEKSNIIHKPNETGTAHKTGGSVKQPASTEFDKRWVWLAKGEYYVVNKAIGYLDGSCGQTRAVVVDMFESTFTNGGRTFSVDDLGVRRVHRVHSVVLYKQGTDFLVIDPSNSTFSHVLISAGINVAVCIDEDFRIYQAPSSGSTGPGKWRDCVDIAVKLAFLLNDTKDNILIETRSLNNVVVCQRSINQTSLKESKAVKTITNLNATYNNIPEQLTTCCVRCHQSSDIIEARVAMFWLKRLRLLHLKFKALLEASGIDPFLFREKFDETYGLQRISTSLERGSDLPPIESLQTFCNDMDKFVRHIRENPEVIFEIELCISENSSFQISEN
jgi:hypothetical protein